MWKNKKVLIIGVISVLVVLGSLGGVIIAQAADSPVSGNATQLKTVTARAAEILGIDQTKLENAFTQARNEAAADALKIRLQSLVTAGKITQAQADEYLKWSESKPDITPFQNQYKEWMQSRPTLPSDLKEWQQAKPDVQLPGGIAGRNFKMMPRMGGMMGVR